MTTIAPDNSNEFSTFNREFKTNYKFTETPHSMKAVQRPMNDLTDFNYSHTGELPRVNVNVDVSESSIWESAVVGWILKGLALAMFAALAFLTLSSMLNVI